MHQVKRYFLTGLLGLITAGTLWAQDSLRVLNEEGEGIYGAILYKQSKTQVRVSGREGWIKNLVFSPQDTLNLQHSTYQSIQISYAQLLSQGFIVEMKALDLGLDEIIISASKWEQDPREVPLRIQSIKAQEIAFQNPQTAADLLNTSGEVFIQKSQMGGGSPMIRGFATSGVLLVVDGVRMNNAIFRQGNVQNVIVIDPNLIEKAEVIIGSGPVIYGSDALGGVMDFHTSRPSLNSEPGSKWGLNTLSRYSSANREKTGHIDLSWSNQRWGLISSLSYSDFDDLRMGANGREEYRRLEYVARSNNQDQVFENNQPLIQKFSGYSQLNLTQKIRFRPHSRLNFDYGFHYSRSSEVPRYDRLIQRREGALRYAEWAYGPQTWMMQVLEVQYLANNAYFDQFKVNLSYQLFEESRVDRRFNNAERRIRTERLHALSLSLDFDKELKKESTLFYGFQGIFNRVNSEGISQNIGTNLSAPVASRYPDGSNYFSGAFYLNYKKNWKKFTLSSGLRYSVIELNADFENNEDFYTFPFEQIHLQNGAFTGSTGLVFRPNERWKISSNLSSAFRAPNIDDAAKVFDSSPGNVVVPNENLKPEYAYSVDFGVEKEVLNNVWLNLNLFHTWVENQMQRANARFQGEEFIEYDGELSRVQSILNTGRAKIYGASAQIRIQFSKGLRFNSQITYTQGKAQNGEALRHVAPLFGRTELVYQIKSWQLNLYALYNGEISYSNLAESEREKAEIYASDAQGQPFSPAWATLNLKIQYQLGTHFTLQTGLENILDQAYRPYSSGIVAPGRNLILSLRTHW